MTEIFRDRGIPQVLSKSLLVILKSVLLIIFKWIFDTPKQFILAENIPKRDGSNSIVTEHAKRMEIARVLEAYFRMLMVDGSKVLSARLALVMLFMQRCGVCTLVWSWHGGMIFLSFALKVIQSCLLT